MEILPKIHCILLDVLPFWQAVNNGGKKVYFSLSAAESANIVTSHMTFMAELTGSMCFRSIHEVKIDLNIDEVELDFLGS